MGVENPTPARAADSAVHALIGACRRGEIGEAVARRRIAETLLGAGIVEEVVAGLPPDRFLGAQDRADLVDDLRLGLVEAVVGARARAVYDLSAGASASASGWARRWVRTAAGRATSRKNRAIKARHVHVPIPEPGAAEISSPTLGAWLPETVARREQETLELLDRFVVSAHGARPTRLTRLRYLVLRDHFGVPDLARPAPAERERAAAELGADTGDDGRPGGLALASLRSWLDRAGSGVLEGLWSTWTPEHAAAVLECDDRTRLADITHALALGAVWDYPRPNRDVVRAWNARVESLGASAAWREHSAELAASFLAAETEPVSQYARSVPAGRAREVASAHARARRMLADRLEAAAEALGTDPDLVMARLRGLADDLGMFDVVGDLPDRPVGPVW